MPIFMAFIVLAGFADNTLTGKTGLFVGLGLLAVVVVQTVVHYLSEMCIRDRLRAVGRKAARQVSAWADRDQLCPVCLLYTSRCV